MRTVHQCQLYREMIRDADGKAADYTSEDDLFRSPGFIEIYESPEAYYACTLSLLSSADVRTSTKHAAIMAMQNINTDAFLHLTNFVLVLRYEGKVDFEVVRTIFEPPAEWANALVYHYEDPRVRAAYDAYIQLPEVGEEDQRWIRDQVLTGKLAEVHRLQRENLEHSRNGF